MRCNGSNWAVYSPGSWDGFRNDLWALWAGVIMRLEHHLVGGYVRYISPHIIIIIITQGRWGLIYTERNSHEGNSPSYNAVSVHPDVTATYWLQCRSVVIPPVNIPGRCLFQSGDEEKSRHHGSRGGETCGSWTNFNPESHSKMCVALEYAKGQHNQIWARRMSKPQAWTNN